MTENYWEGATWVYHADIVNDGSNSGNHVYTVVPGVGNELEVLFGSVLNGDTASRTVQFSWNTAISGGEVLEFYGLSLGAGLRMALFPSDGQADQPIMGRHILSGGMSLSISVSAVAVNQDSALGFVGRLRGSIPMVTLTSPTDAVETVNITQVF